MPWMSHCTVQNPVQCTVQFASVHCIVSLFCSLDWKTGKQCVSKWAWGKGGLCHSRSTGCICSYCFFHSSKPLCHCLSLQVFRPKSKVGPRGSGLSHDQLAPRRDVIDGLPDPAICRNLLANEHSPSICLPFLCQASSWVRGKCHRRHSIRPMQDEMVLVGNGLASAVSVAQSWCMWQIQHISIYLHFCTFDHFACIDRDVCGVSDCAVCWLWGSEVHRAQSLSILAWSQCLRVSLQWHSSLLNMVAFWHILSEQHRNATGSHYATSIGMFNRFLRFLQPWDILWELRVPNVSCTIHLGESWLMLGI
jgi:hypothetical protein